MPSSEDRLRRLFEAGHELTYAAIKQRLGLSSDRHARRLVGQLRAAGLPVQERSAGRTKHFTLAPEDRREAGVPLALTPQEALALLVAVGAGRAMLNSTPLSGPLATAFQRLVEQLTPQVDWVDLDAQQDRWYFGAIARNRIDPDVFSTLLQGLEQQQSVLIDYGKPGRPVDAGRKIDPHCFAVVGNAVMVAAYCHRNRALRDFSLPRIRRAVLCDPKQDPRPYFTRRDDFDPQTYYASERFGAIAGGEVQVFRMLVEPDRAPFFHEREYHHSQDIEHEEEDGRVQVSFEAVGFEDMRSFAQSWGVGETVVEPPELVERLREEAETLARRYRDADE